MTELLTIPVVNPSTATEFPWMGTFTLTARDGRELTWTRRDAVTGEWSGDTGLATCAAALSGAHELPDTFAAACWAAQVLMRVPGELVLVNRLAGVPARRRADVYECGHEHRTWHSAVDGFLTPPPPRAVPVKVEAEVRFPKRKTLVPARRRAAVYACGHEHRTWHSAVDGFLTPPEPRVCTPSRGAVPQALALLWEVRGVSARVAQTLNS